MFGASQGMAMTQTQSPEKKAKQEDRQTCTPATTRLLLDACKAAEQEGREVQLHGAEAANITLVGVVENLVQQATVVEFTLNDGSGRVKVRQYKNSDAPVAALVSGQYASVVGSLRTSPAVHVSALSLRPVASADEVSYHMIEVAHVALMMKGGNAAKQTPVMKAEAPAAAAPSSVPAPAATPVPAAAPAPAAVAPAAAPAAAPQTADVRTATLEVLQAEGESRAEGVHISVMVERLKAFSAEAVKQALEQLVSDGEAYTTIDDDHFSPL